MCVCVCVWGGGGADLFNLQDSDLLEQTILTARATLAARPVKLGMGWGGSRCGVGPGVLEWESVGLEVWGGGGGGGGAKGGLNALP